MKTVIDGIYPFTACFDMNMTKFEYEALPFREWYQIKGE